MGDVFFAARIEIIRTENFIALAQEPFAQMRSKEACTSSDKDFFAIPAFHSHPILAEKMP
jgi:hypothetical protein